MTTTNTRLPKEKTLNYTLRGKPMYIKVRRLLHTHLDGSTSWSHYYYGNLMPRLFTKKAVLDRIEYLKTIPQHVWDHPDFN